MDRVGIVTDFFVLDTSWLLELYKVPGDSTPQRHPGVLEDARLAAEKTMLVTIPVLFEVANHIVHVRNGHHRRKLIEQYRDDLNGSLREQLPWRVFPVENGILLRAEDLINLSDRFAKQSSIGYSLADISVIDLTRQLQRRGASVRILAFDKQLEAYAG